MKEYLDSLQPRERNLVLGLAGIVLVALVYFVLYQPLQTRLERAQTSLNREVKLSQWVETNATKVAILRTNQGVTSSGGSLDQLVNRSAREFGLVINRLQPQNNKLNVTLDKVKFSSVLQWLEKLQHQNGINIDSVDFRAESTPGLVRVRVLLAK
ncbi:MAG: type II secretion system protein M [Gammaproteobacteria bacterium]|nr:type II secretion system protein M [Gammaproteobacteria bacterium]